jgi:hypothetical protein
VIWNESPFGSETVVTRMFVFGRYRWVVATFSGGAGEETEKCPPSGSRILPKTGGLSGLGRHNQSMEPWSLINAEIWQLPMSPYGYM